jgi:hypothetical protein
VDALTPADRANTVTAYAIILAGLNTLLLSAWMGPQPPRWTGAYGGIVLTGVATVWYRGFGEPSIGGGV